MPIAGKPEIGGTPGMRNACWHARDRVFMKLNDLLGADAITDARFAALDVRGISADSRTIRPGDLFVAVAGAKDDGLRFAADALARGRRGRHGRTGAADAACRRRRLHQGRQRAAGPGAGGGEILSAPAAGDRGDHRHQREDVGRRVHPPDSGPRSAQAPRASARSGWSRRGAKSTARSPRRIRSRCTARSTSSPAKASLISPSKPPRTVSISTASTAFGLRPAASPISAATISTITRRSRPISPPSSGCSRI